MVAWCDWSKWHTYLPSYIRTCVTSLWFLLDIYAHTHGIFFLKKWLNSWSENNIEEETGKIYCSIHFYGYCSEFKVTYYYCYDSKAHSALQSTKSLQFNLTWPQGKQEDDRSIKWKNEVTVDMLNQKVSQGKFPTSLNCNPCVYQTIHLLLCD